jgi:thioredoxin-related protein
MKTIVIALALFAAQFGFSQESQSATAEIKWLSIEDAYAQNKENPKKILVDVYTDWCGWCKRMDKTTYENPEIIRYINENYYPVKLDGEDKNDITILDNTFKFVQSGRNGYHELAAALLDGKLSYPTTVFLDESFQMIQPVPGYLDAAGIEPILWFFASDAYKNSDWDSFQKTFNSKL